MTSLTRALRPVILPAAIAVCVLAVALTAGCGGSPSSSRSSASAAAAAPASPAPAAADTSAAVVNPGGPMQPAGADVYFAEGGDVQGTTAHEPSCAKGCALSGDGTAELSAMTWQTWTGSKAVGTGTEKIDDCTPNCAAGTLYPVKATVTFTEPVRVCADETSRWYWTRVSFAWPDGLPAPLRGANAPTNPLVYSQITDLGHMSCA